MTEKTLFESSLELLSEAPANPVINEINTIKESIKKLNKLKSTIKDPYVKRQATRTLDELSKVLTEVNKAFKGGTLDISPSKKDNRDRENRYGMGDIKWVSSRS